MAVLHVRHIPDKLYRQVQRIAEAQGKTLSDLVISLLEERANREADRRRHARAMAQVRRNLAHRSKPKGVLTGAELVHSARAERDVELAIR